MCAIAGMVGLHCGDTVLDRMERTMSRRGPDDRGRITNGACTLLHSRLTIIDPVGGAQPMTLTFGNESYSLVYNGELYNTEQLRRELIGLRHTFHGHSDTEVVLHAYAQWKETCLQKFNGIFGFAVWEGKAQRLFLARDRMGVKPLFYAQTEDGILFASEIKTILAHGAVSARLDREGAAQLLLLGPGRIPGSGVLKGICELEPGCCGFFAEGRWQQWRYWKLQDREHRESFEETAEHVRFLVTDAIKRQMVSDVPIGTFLSGGLDSSLISSVCAQNTDGPLQTFSVDYQDNASYFVPGKFQPESDNRYIEIMRDYLGAEHHWTVLTPQELAAELEAATRARDIPGMGDVDFSLLAFCRQIRPYVKVALSGECADEIFGGYPWYRDPQIRSAEGFPWAQNTHIRESFLAPWLRQGIDCEAFVREQYSRTIRESDILPENSPLERRMKEMVNLNMRWFMQTLLDRKDRMSMYCGLEVRVPFCDYRIAEYLYCVPWEYKEYEGREKGLLRYAMKEYLPPQVLYRKKSPYPKTWDPAYKQIMEQALQQELADTGSPLWSVVDAEAVRKLQNNELSVPWYGQLMRAPQTMAYLLQLAYWLRQYQVELVES